MKAIAEISDEDLRELYTALRLHEETLRTTRIEELFPEHGPLGWREYKKHYAFWKLGTVECERAMICANRVGKTVAGAFETACHVTGRYREWWPGVRYDRAIKAWACGDTSDTVRDIIQSVLMGEKGEWGTGLIPRRFIVDVQLRRGGGSALDNVWVSRDGDEEQVSVLQFKSYEQGRKTFQGTRMDLIWLDEEPTMDVYAECQLRTMATRAEDRPGQLIATFTPLQGMSDVCLHFLPGGRMPAEPVEE